VGERPVHGYFAVTVKQSLSRIETGARSGRVG